MKLKMNLEPSDPDYDPSSWLTGYRKRPTLTQAQRDMIEVKVQALAYKRRIEFEKRNGLPVRY